MHQSNRSRKSFIIISYQELKIESSETTVSYGHINVTKDARWYDSKDRHIIVYINQYVFYYVEQRIAYMYVYISCCYL